MFTAQWATSGIPFTKYRIDFDGRTGYQLIYDGYYHSAVVNQIRPNFAITIIFELFNLETIPVFLKYF